jgi:hypothetical protein
VEGEHREHAHVVRIFGEPRAAGAEGVVEALRGDVGVNEVRRDEDALAGLGEERDQTLDERNLLRDVGRGERLHGEPLDEPRAERALRKLFDELLGGRELGGGVGRLGDLVGEVGLGLGDLRLLLLLVLRRLPPGRRPERAGRESEREKGARRERTRREDGRESHR